MKALLVFLLLILVQIIAGAVLRNFDYHVKLVQQLSDDDNEDINCTIISEDEIKRVRVLRNDLELFVTKRPAIQSLAEGGGKVIIGNNERVIEIFGRSKEIIQGHIDILCKNTKKLEPIKLGKSQRAAEVFKIVDSGENANRIDVVFMGDGYNASQRQQFLDDITRLTTEMFAGETFRSWLPLFNIWAIYVESVDTGIGYNGPQNTPFKLYREQGQLRVIYPGNATYARQVCLLTGTSGCDYPSLIGNDDFYGGLGGEFVISTKSNRTGNMVLRHEMGHNLAFVGDEYDNSPTYYGVNSATSVESLGWTSWLTGGQREERAQYRVLQYPWADLSLGPQNFTFTSDGTFNRWYCLVSVSAAGENDSLEFTIDGEILPWTTTGFDDREFYYWYGNQGFTAGTHNFTVRSKTTPTHPMIPRMIASINIHEYGSESEFVEDNNHYSAYPTWGENGNKTYRPTNAGCLMRNITQTKFCHVCKEGMWHQFLGRISIIDNVEITGNIGNQNATVNTLKLGQWRPIGNELEGEQLQIRWTRNGVDEGQYNDQLTVDHIEAGNWTVTCTLISPEVRSDPNGLLTDSESFVVSSL